MMVPEESLLILDSEGILFEDESKLGGKPHLTNHHSVQSDELAVQECGWLCSLCHIVPRLRICMNCLRCSVLLMNLLLMRRVRNDCA